MRLSGSSIGTPAYVESIMIEKKTQYHLQIPDPVHYCMEVLSKGGHEAWLVGGSVRDLSMGRTPTDYDLTTDATPEAIQMLFSDRKTLDSGMKHGTVTVIVDGKPVEITTYRTEGAYSDGRRPDYVEFTPSLEKDLVRRDFTINTLVLNDKGILLDYTGGLDDIRNGLIRCVGDASDRFREDALRVIRALRFASVLGFTIEPETSAALSAQASLLRHIAAERIWTEFTGLLCGGFVRPILEDYADIFAIIIPEIPAMRNFDQRNPYHKYDVWAHTIRVVEGVPPEKVIRLAALFHDVGKPATFTLDTDGIGHFYGHDAEGARMASEILLRMKCDTRTRTSVEELIRIHCVPISPDEKTVKRRLNQYGAETIHRLIDLKIADAKAQSELSADRIAPLLETREAVRDCVARAECFSIKSLAIDGADLIQIGMKEGPEIGKLLEDLLQKVICGEVKNDRTALLGYVISEKEVGSDTIV